MCWRQKCFSFAFAGYTQSRADNDDDGAVVREIGHSRSACVLRKPCHWFETWHETRATRELPKRNTSSGFGILWYCSRSLVTGDVRVEPDWILNLQLSLSLILSIYGRKWFLEYVSTVLKLSTQNERQTFLFSRCRHHALPSLLPLTDLKTWLIFPPRTTSNHLFCVLPFAHKIHKKIERDYSAQHSVLSLWKPSVRGANKWHIGE